MKALQGLLLGLLLSCSSLLAAEPLPPAFYAQTYSALEKGDTEQLLGQLKRVYAQLGVAFPEALVVKLQPFDQPLSGYNDDQLTITLSEMMKGPGQGLAYWNKWSQVLTDGQWKPEAHYASQESMRLAGNFALLGILAHEMGHATDYRYDLSTSLSEQPNQALKELVADQLALLVLRSLAQDPRFRSLLQQYQQQTLGSLQPGGTPKKLWTLPAGGDLRAYALQHEVPGDNPGLYVSYQLARQRELLEHFDFEAYRQSLTSRVARQELQWRQEIRYPIGQAEVRPVAPCQPDKSLWASVLGSDVYPAGRAARWALRAPTDKELWLEPREDPRTPRSISLEPLIELTQARWGIQYPTRLTSYHNFTSYLWDLIPIGPSHYQALMINRHRLTRRATGSAPTTLWVLDYLAGAPPRQTFSLSVSPQATISAALKQSAEGEVRLFVSLQEAPEQAARVQVYGWTGESWERVEELSPSTLAQTGIEPHSLLRGSLMGAKGELIFPTASRIQMLADDSPLTLAGCSLRGNQNGPAQGQVCNQPALLYREASGALHFINQVGGHYVDEKCLQTLP